MDIGALQFNPTFQQDITSQVEENKAKDFDAILKKATESKDNKALKDACVQLETYMLSQIFKQLKKSTVSEEGLIPKGDYEKTFEDYMVNNQCEEMSKAGGIGLADMMYKQMINTYGTAITKDAQKEAQIDQEA